MSDASTHHMIEMYMEEAEAPMFLSGFFQSPPRNFHTSEKVDIDIMRDDLEVAVVVTDLRAGRRLNESSKYTAKSITPPIYDEEGVIDAYSTLKRRAGMNPFQQPDFLANAAEDAFRIFRKLEKKIRRAIEVQSSQVLQTGDLTLKDKTGADIYTLDFGAKATHFPTAAVAWADGGGDDKLGDLEALAKVVRRDGRRKPNKLVFGSVALRKFLDDAKVQERLDNRRMNLGEIMPQPRGEGATFYGWVWIGAYRFEIWGYDAFYKDPQTGLHVDYLDEDNVMMLSEDGRLDLTYGAIPIFRDPSERPLPFLPSRMNNGPLGLDLTTNSWISPDGKHLMVSAGTRPLTIPTAVDTFGCLTTA